MKMVNILYIIGNLLFAFLVWHFAFKIIIDGWKRFYGPLIEEKIKQEEEDKKELLREIEKLLQSKK